MSDGLIIRALLIAFGAIVLTRAVFALANKRITETVGVGWGLFSAVFILSGIILHPDHWREYVSTKGLILVVIIIACFSYGLFLLSETVSENYRKSNEMAMQISLLNTENERLSKEVEELKLAAGLEDKAVNEEGKSTKADVSDT